MTTRKPIEDAGDYRGTTPPPNSPPPVGERHFIERPADLAAAAHALARSPLLAIDVEFVSGRPSDAHQPPRLALIQIADGVSPHCYVIDALRLVDLTPLAAPFEQPDSVKIFHGVGSDLRVLAARGLAVWHTLDIEAVSRALFGSRESGLQAMLHRACGVWLDKSLQRSDWTQRPLSTAMFAYAARDAEMTLALAHWLNEHYRWAMDLYEDDPADPTPAELVAPWLATFILGERTFPPELLDAVDHGALEPAQDCIAALGVLRKPTWRARVLRAAADLTLMPVATPALASLTARTGEERAAAARALGRLRATPARAALIAATADPIFDVRRAAITALEQLDLPPRIGRFGRTDVYAPEPSADIPDDSPWKAKLRDLLPDDGE
jgi:hypothetical protein